MQFVLSVIKVGEVKSPIISLNYLFLLNFSQFLLCLYTHYVQFFKLNPFFIRKYYFICSSHIFVVTILKSILINMCVVSSTFLLLLLMMMMRVCLVYECIQVFIYVNGCGVQRLSEYLRIFSLIASPHSVLRQKLSLNHRLTSLARMGSQRVPTIHISVFGAGITGDHYQARHISTCAGDPHCIPHALHLHAKHVIKPQNHLPFPSYCLLT